MSAQNSAHSPSPASTHKEYYAAGSMSLLLYDLMARLSTATLAGDIEFYASFAAPGSTSILELGAGTGRVANALAARGFSVIGLDRSLDMLRLAKSKLDKADSDAKGKPHLFCADMTRFALDRQFDLVIAPFYSFSHLLTSEERYAALQCIRAHVAPTGRVILHLVSAQVLSTDIAETELQRQGLTLRTHAATPSIGIQVSHRAVDRHRRVCDQYIEYAITPQDGAARTSIEAMRYGWMDETELATLLKATGFTLIERRSSFTQDPGIEDILVLAPLHDR